MINKAYDINLFSRFIVGISLVVSHLQYANDTLIFSEPSIENLWIIKAVMRWF